MFAFRKIWYTLFSCYLRLEILSFVFLPTNSCGYGYFTASFEQVLYSVQMWENTGQKNSEYEYFLRSEYTEYLSTFL